MPCEMCGKDEMLVKADIEGAELQVCRGCARFGKILSRVVTPPKGKSKKVEAKPEPKPSETVMKEIIQVITDDYPQLIKNAREKLGLKQNELARMIAEKESLVQNVESGKFLPSINLAKKFERFLKITLVEQHEEAHDQKFKTKASALTIGDMLSFKK